MTQQYGQPWINGQVNQAATALIFDSTLASPTDVAFNDWDALLAKAATIQGEKRILIQNQTTVIPAGTYDMTDIYLVGLDPIVTRLQIDDAILNNLLGIKGLFVSVADAVANTASNFVYDDGGNDSRLIVENSVLSMGANGAVPMISVVGGTFLTISAYTSAFASQAAAQELIAVDATSRIDATTGTEGVQGGNIWGGPSGSNAFLDITAGGTGNLILGTGDVYWAADNANGFTNVVRIEDYEPGDGADWADPDPTSVQEALDRIAAQLAAVGAAPIP